jgi:hypothetical protein
VNNRFSPPNLPPNGGTKPAIEPPAEAPAMFKDWPAWKAAMLNELFRQQGVTGQPGRITAETVRHGERLPARGQARKPQVTAGEHR